MEPKQVVLPDGQDPRVKEVDERGIASHARLVASLDELADIHRRMDALAGVTRGA